MNLSAKKNAVLMAIPLIGKIRIKSFSVADAMSFLLEKKAGFLKIWALWVKTIITMVRQLLFTLNVQKVPEHQKNF
ncbi:hypothetical protein A3N47_10035 [Enterobacter hormaechei subsp. xiangfangensis]|nr:hypothetical protein A3N47_10035 [Enterobacter hormaechei subsp. xiangfangensis]